MGERMLREERLVWVTALCFLVGGIAGTIVLQGNPRPIAGDGSVGIPMAVIAGVLAAASFVISSLMHRRGETAGMPRWQAIVSDLAAIALTIAFAGVTALGVLLAGEVLGVGLRGLELPAIGGGVLTGVVSAVGGRFAFGAGFELSTRDIAGLLFGYLIVGTLLAMLTAADPMWWELNFSQLGSGAGAWAFNGTLLVAGLLVATVGAYIGRDLHRLRGDDALSLIGWMVALWAATGVALACVGLFPVHRMPMIHDASALATALLFAASAVLTVVAVPGPPRPLVITTIGVGVLVVGGVVMHVPLRWYSMTVLEAIIVGLGLVWMTTLVRIVAVLAPTTPRASARSRLRGRPRLLRPTRPGGPHARRPGSRSGESS